MTREILPPGVDVVFKRLMGDANDTRFLADFLQAVLDLPATDFARLVLRDPHILGHTPDDKTGILDVRVETVGGHQIDVEIQLASLPEMPQRILFYLARMLDDQTASGKSYRDIRRTICILITGYRL
ncbi:MAG: Rpn family recombination-promoting nuclease/putative transposase, partial [Candidatus Accumulibacter sp.]|nr:Rpn family recombination-promoting nuclease/putative transposase [Accumulibacter sp.]